jgi:hypothetical protein
MKSIYTFFSLCYFILFINFSSLAQDCDIIILTDGSEVNCTVTEIRVNEIAYKKCDFQSGPLYVVLKNDVFLIKYRNGEKELISQQTIQPLAEKSNEKVKPEVVKPEKKTRVVSLKSESELLSTKECVNFHLMNGTVVTGIIYKFHRNDLVYISCDGNNRFKYTKWFKTLDFISSKNDVIIYTTK